MKQLLTLCILLTLLAGCGGAHSIQKKYFPKICKDLHLGMPLEEFARVRKRLPSESLTREEFRYSWLETFPRDKYIDAVVYFFDAEGDRPLYEMVIFYKDLTARDAWITRRYGPPNHNTYEWKFVSGENFPIRAWKFEERLVIIGEIEGTEWEDGGEKE